MFYRVFFALIAILVGVVPTSAAELSEVPAALRGQSWCNQRGSCVTFGRKDMSWLGVDGSCPITRIVESRPRTYEFTSECGKTKTEEFTLEAPNRLVEKYWASGHVAYLAYEGRKTIKMPSVVLGQWCYDADHHDFVRARACKEMTVTKNGWKTMSSSCTIKALRDVHGIEGATAAIAVKTKCDAEDDDEGVSPNQETLFVIKRDRLSISLIRE